MAETKSDIQQELQIIQNEISETEQQIETHKAFLELGFYEEGLTDKLKTLEAQQKKIDNQMQIALEQYTDILIENIHSIDLSRISTKLTSEGSQKTVFPLELTPNGLISFLHNTDTNAHVYSDPYTGIIEGIEIYIKSLETKEEYVTLPSEEQQKRLLEILDQKLHLATKGIISELGIGLAEALSDPSYLKFTKEQLAVHEKLSKLIDIHFILSEKIELTKKQTEYRLKSINELSDKLEMLREQETELIEQAKVSNKVKAAAIKGREAISKWLDRISDVLREITSQVSFRAEPNPLLNCKEKYTALRGNSAIELSNIVEDKTFHKETKHYSHINERN